MEHGTDVCPGVEGLALMVATRLFGFRFDAGQRSEMDNGEERNEVSESNRH